MNSNTPSDRYDIRCPHCRASYRCLAVHLGKRVACTKCGREFDIPEVVCLPESPESPPIVDWDNSTKASRTSPQFSSNPVIVTSRGYGRQVRRSNHVKLTVAIVALVCGAVIMVLLIGAVMSAVGDADVSQKSRGPTEGGDIVLMILGTALLFLLLIVSMAAYLLPTWIALYRKHRFVGVIFVLNLAGGWSVVGWFVALGWAVWPSETVFTDVLTHDPTGLSLRNVGHAAGEIHNAYDDVRQSRVHP